MRATVLVLFAVLALGCNKAEPVAVKEEGGRAAAPTPTPVPDKGKPEATFPPDSWTHRDLADHLGKKGVKVEVSNAGIFDKPERPAAWFESADKATVIVFLCTDAKAAREAAGAETAGSFAFGRFAVCNRYGKSESKDLTAAIKKALELR